MCMNTVNIPMTVWKIFKFLLFGPGLALISTQVISNNAIREIRNSDF